MIITYKQIADALCEKFGISRDEPIHIVHRNGMSYPVMLVHHVHTAFYYVCTTKEESSEVCEKVKHDLVLEDIKELEGKVARLKKENGLSETDCERSGR